MQHLILTSDILIAYVKNRLNHRQVLLLEDALLHQPESQEEVLWILEMLEQGALDAYLEMQGWEESIDYEALFDANLRQAESLLEITTEDMVAYVKGELPKEEVLILEEKLLRDKEQQETLSFLLDLHEEGMLEEGLLTMEKGWTLDNPEEVILEESSATVEKERILDSGDGKKGMEERKLKDPAAKYKPPFSFLQIAATVVGILIAVGVVFNILIPQFNSDEPAVRSDDQVLSSDDLPERPIRGGYVADRALELALATETFDTPGKKLRLAAYLLDRIPGQMGPLIQKVLWDNYYLLPAREISGVRRFDPVEYMAFLEQWYPANQLPITNEWMKVDWKEGELLVYHPHGQIIGSATIDLPKQLGLEISGKGLWVLTIEEELIRLRTPEGIRDWLRFAVADFIPQLDEQERQAALPD